MTKKKKRELINFSVDALAWALTFSFWLGLLGGIGLRMYMKAATETGNLWQVLQARAIVSTLVSVGGLPLGARGCCTRKAQGRRGSNLRDLDGKRLRGNLAGSPRSHHGGGVSWVYPHSRDHRLWGSDRSRHEFLLSLARSVVDFSLTHPTQLRRPPYGGAGAVFFCSLSIYT